MKILYKSRPWALFSALACAESSQHSPSFSEACGPVALARSLPAAGLCCALHVPI